VSELVVAANRGPFALSEQPDGTIVAAPAGGGLAPSLASAIAHSGEQALWVAAAMSDVERKSARTGAVSTGHAGLSLHLVDLDEATYRAAYEVIANSTLWFCFHGLFDRSRRPLFDRRWREAWEQFRLYNTAFADRICEQAAPGARVLVNDYHLPLVGRALAAQRPDLRTVHFTHTPFATEEELRLLPRDARRELVEGLGGFGACGFHTARWQERFAAALATTGNTTTAAFAAPLGANPDRLMEVAATPACDARLQELDELLAGRQMLLRSDRMELSKNILRGFHAFDELLEAHPSLRGRVCFVARAYPSREGLAEYLAYRSEVEHLAEVLNERWTARCGGEPPVVLIIDDDFPASVAAFRRYDVLLVNPIRDGMNLVAKEGPTVNGRDGVLVLSEEAGAYEELGEVALGVQPFDVSDTAAALARALEMPADERRRRAGELRRLSGANAPHEWLAAVLSSARAPRP
jgi:trehalose 6-phosphate synthase